MQVLVSGLVLRRKGKDAQAFFEVIELVSGGWRSFRSAHEEGATRVELEPFGNNYELPAFHAHCQTPPTAMPPLQVSMTASSTCLIHLPII
jgi:hypothetical protein